MEIAVVAETKEIKLEGLTFYHTFTRYIGNVDSSIIRLARHRAQAGKFRAVEFDEIVPVGMLIDEGFQKARVVILPIYRMLAAQFCNSM